MKTTYQAINLKHKITQILNELGSVVTDISCQTTKFAQEQILKKIILKHFDAMDS